MTLKKDGVYKNKKTGNFYYIIDFAYDAESEVSKEKQHPLVIYTRVEISHKDLWVRSVLNFKEKFEPVMDGKEHTMIDNLYDDFI